MAVACQNVSTDIGGRLSLHELTEQVVSLQFPARASRLYAVFAVVQESAGMLIANRVEVIAASGETVYGMEFPDIVFRVDQPVQRIVAGITGVLLPTPGRYRVQLTSRGRVVAAFPLDAVLLVQKTNGAPA
jgi:hypothetical protein